MPIKVLLVDDHRIVRDGLKTLLNQGENIEVVGETDNGRDAVRLAESLSPDVIVMDVGLPDLNGIDATNQIVSQAPKTKIIALSMHSDRRFVAGMIRAGASGYLLKDSAFEELEHAIKTVHEENHYLSPSIAGVMIQDYLATIDDINIPCAPELTPREREVLQLLAEGHNTLAIAEVLHVSRKTIETHRAQIMDKLNFHSIAELTKYAVREGLTSL